MGSFTLSGERGGTYRTGSDMIKPIHSLYTGNLVVRRTNVVWTLVLVKRESLEAAGLQAGEGCSVLPKWRGVY
jgi:hypothetical protein